MMVTTNNAVWETMTPEQKRWELYVRQVVLLDTFLEHGAVTQAQHGLIVRWNRERQIRICGGKNA